MGTLSSYMMLNWLMAAILFALANFHLVRRELAATRYIGLVRPNRPEWPFLTRAGPETHTGSTQNQDIFNMIGS